MRELCQDFGRFGGVLHWDLLSDDKLSAGCFQDAGLVHFLCQDSQEVDDEGLPDYVTLR